MKIFENLRTVWLLCLVTVPAAFFFSCAGSVGITRSGADSCYKAGDYEKAEKMYADLLEKSPDDADIHYRLGVIYKKRGQVEKSRNSFLKAVSLDSNYSKAYYNLGAIYSAPGPFQDEQKAIFFFKKYLEFDSDPADEKKIKRWLATHEDRETLTNYDQKIKDEKASKESPDKTDDNFRDWLKEQSDVMGQKK
jgi:tetratricopeptide (TPR) repeat protein